MFENAVLHLDLDCFFVSVECLKDPSLKGKPVMIGGRSGRGVVASCNYEARAFGIHSAMPMQRALRLCPHATVLKGDMEAYSAQSRAVTDIIKAVAPVFEKASIDEFYIDLTGMDKFIGCQKWSAELRQKIIAETGLPISAGLSVNKTVSKIATGVAKPNGAKFVAAGTEKNFLAPLSPQKIPGLGAEAFRRLTAMGIHTIGALSRLSPDLLEKEFGKSGKMFWKRANGIDHTPVVPYHDSKSMSTERTFHADTADVQFLKDYLSKMVTELAFDLRKSHWLTACVTVKVRYSDFSTFTLQRQIVCTANDQKLIRQAHQLFEQLYQKNRPVRLIGVRFSHLTRGNYQTRLFENIEEETSLFEAMDTIRERFGQRSLTWATTMYRHQH
jgi:DNA polymerase-4